MNIKTDKIYLATIIFLFLVLAAIFYFIVDYQSSEPDNNRQTGIGKQAVICYKDKERIPQEGIDNLNLLGIWGTSANNVFAVGDDGVILNYDGSKWRKEASPVDSSLYCIRGINKNRVFACGSKGVIIEYDGKEWKKNRTGIDKFINSIWFASENKGFAVGTDGIILQYEGKEWKKSVDPSIVENANFSDVMGFSEDDVYAVGSQGTYRYDGRNWKKIHLPSSNWQLCIWGIDKNNFFVGAENGLIINFQGKTIFEEYAGTKNSTFGLWGSSSSNIYGATSTKDGGAIIHYDGKSWKQIAESEGYLSDIWGVDENLFFIVGEGKK